MTNPITEQDYTKEMKQSFIDYAMKTITDRALPDVRDGLKPVHRRILYGMRTMGLTHEKPHKKSARIVGDVMGKYHPHGDSSVYQSMVRLSQDFSVKLPLVDGHGNFGSIDGDEPAAMRYTEARLSQIGEWLLKDMEKETVDFRPNYDDSEIEPTVLPARFPHLLINGIEGIATGMASNIPTHNPKEVADAWLYCLTEKNPTIDGIMKHLSAPDFPKGGVIINKEEMEGFYKTGQARVMTRGDYEVEDAPYGKKNIVFTSLPARSVGSKTTLINHLIQKVNDKVLDEVTDIRDESSREGTRLIIELRKGVDVNRFMNKLFVKTNLQDSQRLHFLVLVDGQPQTLNILSYFEAYIRFQKELIKRHHQFLLKQAERRQHLVEGYLHAFDHMDAVIDAIRGSDTVEASRACLMSGKTEGIAFKLKKNSTVAKRFAFSKAQTDAILAMRLNKLVGLEQDSLLAEQKQLIKDRAVYTEVISKPAKQTALCVKEAKTFQATCAQFARQTRVTTKTTRAVQAVKNVRPVVAVVDRFGMVKLTDKKESGDGTFLYQLDTTTDGRIAVFTNQGNVYQVKCQDIPEGKKGDRGLPLQLLAKMTPEETILMAVTTDGLEQSSYVFVSKQAKGKLVAGKEFITNRQKLQGTRLQEDDEIVAVKPYTGEAELEVVTYHGKNRFIPIADIPAFSRTAVGNYLFRLTKHDRVTDARFKV